MSEGGNKMGASKEGRMSVRDRINAVLQEFFLEEDESSSRSESRTCCDSTAGGGGSSSAVAVVPTPTTVSVAVNCKVADLIKSSSESCFEMSPRSRVSGGDVIVEGSGGTKGGGVGQSCYEKEDATYFVMQNLLAQQLRLIGSLNSRLSSTESKWKEVCQERDQLQVTLERERQHSAEIQSESDVIIRDQEEKIRELQKQLAEATFIKPREDKATCVTPPPPQPPPPPSPPPPSTTPDSMWNDMDVTSPPVNKRPRMDISTGQLETKSKFLLPTSHNTFLSPPSSSSHSSGTGHHPPRHSDSPPQLSPVVTPKSVPKTLGRPRDSRSYLGQQFQDAGDDSVVGGPTDEFQDELEGIHSGGRSHHEQRTDTAAYHQHHHPPVSLSAQQGSSSKTSSSSYSSTSLSPYFSQAPSFPNKPGYTRFMFPDGKRRFMANSSSDSSFQPVNKSSTVPSLPNSHTNSYAAQYHHNSSSNAIRNRSNNFLNLNRPLMKKAPVGIIIPPSHQQHQNQQSQVLPSSSSSFHFRSLDLDGMATEEKAAADSAPHKSQQRQIPEESSSVPSTTPPPPGVVKKRKVGRPPGSGMKSKRIQPTSSTSKSPAPGPSPSGQLANGSLNSQQDTPSTPQKFSQRGRLLKPNRARYSPDPEISVPTPTREKFVTTRKGYFVGQPFVHEMEYSSEHGHEDGEEVHEIGSRKGPPTTCMETEMDEEQQGRPSVQTSSSTGIFEDGGGDGISSSAAGPEIVVEVPQWRISILEGFSDDEERLPNEDDMSDEAFLKRHQKLEQKEKQRKRWDSQRMREESYLERLKRKQEERERQKELRRQQRKRKGRLGTSEEESVTPSVEEIKAIHIGSELPVGAFGHPLPLVEKVDFELVWKTAPSSTTPTTVVPPPAPAEASNSSPPPAPQEIIIVPDEDVPKLSTSTDTSEQVPVQEGIPETSLQTKETCSSGASSPLTTVPSLSSPSLSSISIPSPCYSPPPLEIFPVFEEESSDAPLGSDKENAIEPTLTVEPVETEEDAGIMVVENQPEKSGTDGEENCDPDSPVYSVDLVDYVSEPESVASEGASDTEDTSTVTPEPAESCDLQTTPVSATPSISIPLRSPGSPQVAHHAPEITRSPEICALDANVTTVNGSSEQKTKCSTVVHFPQIASLTAVFSQTNSSALRSVPSVKQTSTSSTIKATAGVSKTSITFFIPNNPLAPRHHHSSSTSIPKRTTNLVVPSSLSSEFSMEKSDS